MYTIRKKQDYSPFKLEKDVYNKKQECKARKVNCGCVYSVYILKPVLFGGICKQ